MANAFSVPQSMGTWIDPINAGLVNTVLNAKQKTYDYNVAKVDNLIQQYTSLPLLRDKDKEYLRERLDTVINTTNQVGKLDMSNNNLTRKIEQNISTAIDNNVLEQLGNSKSIINFEQSVAQKREKHPELYSDINYSYAKQAAGYSEYMSGSTDKIGNLNYVDYKDVNKRLNDFITDIMNKKKDQVVEIPVKDSDGNPTGAIQQTTISGLNTFQIRQLAESQLDSTYDKQIEINGWFNSNGYSNPEKLNSDVSSVYDFQVKSKDARMSAIQTKLSSSGLSDLEKSSLKTEYDGLTSEKTKLEKDKNYLLKNPQAAATFIERERVFANAQDAFGSLYSESTKYVKDDLYFAQQDLDLKKLKLQYDIEKDKKKEAQDFSGANTFVNTLPTKTEDNIPEIESVIDKSIDQYSSGLSTTLKEYRNVLEQEAKKGNKDAVAKINEYNKKLESKKPGETEDDIFSSVVSGIDYNSGIGIIGNRNYAAEIKDSKERLQLLLQGKNNAIAQGESQHIDNTINSEQGVKAFFDNPETKMLWHGTDGKQRAYSVRDVFIASGIMDKTGKKIGDLKSKPELLKALQQSYYADSALSTAANKREYLKKLAESLGENYNSIITKGQPTSYGSVSPTTGISTGQSYTPEVLNPNSKTAQFLLQARRNGVYDSFSWSDQSLSGDDATIGKYLNEDYKSSELYKQNIKRFYDKLPTTQMVGISSKDKNIYNKLAGFITSQPNSTFIPSKADDISTLNIRLDGENVIVSQNQDQSVKGGGKQTVEKQAVILKSDFIKSVPEIADKLDFTTEASFYTLDKLDGKPLKSESIKFYDNSTPSKLYNWSTQVLLAGKPELVPYIDSSSARVAIYNSNKILEKKYPDLSQTVATALSQSSNYSINAVVEKDFNGNPVLDMKLLDKHTGNVIHSMSNSSGINIDNFKKVLDNTPQVFYGIMLNDILAREREEMMMGSKAQSPSYKNLTDSLSNN